MTITDIVDELNGTFLEFQSGSRADEVMRKASDEIKRARAEIKELKAQLENLRDRND